MYSFLEIKAFVKDEHFLKAYIPIVVKERWKFLIFNDLHLLKALYPIDLTEHVNIEKE